MDNEKSKNDDRPLIVVSAAINDDADTDEDVFPVRDIRRERGRSEGQSTRGYTRSKKNRVSWTGK